MAPRGARLIEQAVIALEEQIAALGDQSALPAMRRDLRYWRARCSNMQIVLPQVDIPGSVQFGVRATISRRGQLHEIQIVGEDEADPSAGFRLDVTNRSHA